MLATERVLGQAVDEATQRKLIGQFWRTWAEPRGEIDMDAPDRVSSYAQAFYEAALERWLAALEGAAAKLGR